MSNLLFCFGTGASNRPETPPGARKGAGFDPSKGATTVKLTPLNFPRPQGQGNGNKPAEEQPTAGSSSSSNSKRPISPQSPNRNPPPSQPRNLAPQDSSGSSNRGPPPQNLAPPDSGLRSREETSGKQRSQYKKDNMRRPSNIATGPTGQARDPFACTHLTKLMPISPIDSTYRSHSGGTLPDGIEAPESREQNMRRLYVHDEDRVLLKVVHYGNPTSVGIEFEGGDWQFKPLWAHRAGPRAQIYFHPSAVKAAIVTCGGLCPGLNDVIRQLVFTLDVYGVKEILGIQYGFKGFVDPKYPPVALSRKLVSRVHMAGGSFLGVSRGTPDLNDIVDRLQDWGVNFFFVIGGNGSHAGAHEIYKKCLERKMKIAVVGIPKTIDNDLQLVDKTFGFDTSVEEAQRAINAAFVEASSAYNGVGIVKLMGRQSGFIAMYATLASGHVDIVLIPEVPFILEGEDGVYNFMRKRLEKNGLCVVVIAEGAGQDLLETSGGLDASGNPILGDIGKWFYSAVKSHFGKLKISIDVKYIDPTYMIRARPCNSSDHIFCSVLGQNAVHGAFAGYTDITIGLVNTHYVFLPIPKVIEVARKVDPNSNMWHRTVTTTGQPEFPLVPTTVKKQEQAKVPSDTSPPSPTSASPRSQSPVGESERSYGGESERGESSHALQRPRQRVSQLSIRIDRNNVHIKSFGNMYPQKK